MWDCGRKSEVRDVSKIFGLSNWKKGVAIIYRGKMMGGARQRPERSRVWVGAGWVYALCQTLNRYVNYASGRETGFQEGGGALLM